MLEMRKCQFCGKLYRPRRKDQKFCKGPHIIICKICGKAFEYTGDLNSPPSTCSKECKQKFRVEKLKEKYGIINVSQLDSVKKKKQVSNASEESQAKSKATCLERYGYERANQSPEVRKKISAALKSSEVQEKRKEAFRLHYGVDHVFSSKEFREQHYINEIPKLESTKQSVRKSVFERYGVTSISDIPSGKVKSKHHRESTVFKRYGENCIFKTQQFKDDMIRRFGSENVMNNSDIRRKAFTNKQKKSNLELRMKHMLDAYEIEYIQEYCIQSNEHMHSYDFYLPKYKILIDCDGEYWHSYISDPDGGRIRDDYDDVRLYLVPADHIFYLIVESDFERGLKGLQKILSEIDENVFDYDSSMFNWCRNVGFPYYHYENNRMLKDFNSLYSREFTSYNPNCKLGLSIINNFHKSIYHCSCGDNLSPYDAWNDDELLKKVIANRFIYQNDVEPSKVMQGFNISKIAPKVSVFNPVLAKYLCTNYAPDSNHIIDPFSGFSGRLLGSYAANKSYTGFDAKQEVVDESNTIISFLNMKNCSVVRKDILETKCTSEFKDSIMITCPPYGMKERYFKDQKDRCCDEWIDECIHRYQCKRYVFVVDFTSKYINEIVETISNSSHFSKAKEYIVVID